MKIERLQEISQAEGRVEGFIENSLKDVPDDNQFAQQLSAAWKVLVTGLKELRQENLELGIKLEKAKGLLGEHLLASD